MGGAIYIPVYKESLSKNMIELPRNVCVYICIYVHRIHQYTSSGGKVGIALKKKESFQDAKSA